MGGMGIWPQSYMADVLGMDLPRILPRCAPLCGASLAAAKVLADTVFPVHQAMWWPIVRFATVRDRISGDTDGVHSRHLAGLMRDGENDKQRYNSCQERDKYHPARYVQAVHGQPSDWHHA